MTVTMNVEVSIEEIESMGFVSECYVEDCFTHNDSLESWAEENYMSVGTCIDYIAENNHFEELASQACTSGSIAMVTAFLEEDASTVVEAMKDNTGSMLEALIIEDDDSIKGLLVKLAKYVIEHTDDFEDVDGIDAVLEALKPEPLTPFEAKGWTKDTKLYVETTTTFNAGTILTLKGDDGTSTPMFQDSEGNSAFVSLCNLSECVTTPFEKKGWNKDTRFTTLSGKFQLGQLIWLKHDDNTDRPLITDGYYSFYLRLDELMVHVEEKPVTPFSAKGWDKDTLFITDVGFGRPTLVKIKDDDGSNCPAFIRAHLQGTTNYNALDYDFIRLDDVNPVNLGGVHK